MRNLLNEQQSQRSPSIQSNTSRGSRINNTVGVNINEEDFLKMFKEKENSKKKKGRTRQRSSRPKENRRNAIHSHSFDPPDNENSVEYEEIVRNRLDMAIQQTERVFSTEDPSLL